MPAVGQRLCLVLLFVAFECRALALPFTFSNTNVIFINDSTAPPTKAGPYPSSLTVTGLAGQVITKATVTLNGFSHDYPSDVTMLLVGPGGQKTHIFDEWRGE